jgi:acylphosphatase
MNKRAHIFYSGSVQGIGFRFAAERLAGAFGLRGWVANLEDGRVEVLLEGKEDDITAFMDKIEDLFSGYIRNTNVDWSKATDEFAGFEIRFE